MHACTAKATGFPVLVTHLVRALHDGLALAGGHAAGNLRGVLAVVHQQHLELTHVENAELEEACMDERKLVEKLVDMYFFAQPIAAKNKTIHRVRVARRARSSIPQGARSSSTCAKARPTWQCEPSDATGRMLLSTRQSSTRQRLRSMQHRHSLPNQRISRCYAPLGRTWRSFFSVPNPMLGRVTPHPLNCLRTRESIPFGRLQLSCNNVKAPGGIVSRARRRHWAQGLATRPPARTPSSSTPYAP